MVPLISLVRISMEALLIPTTDPIPAAQEADGALVAVEKTEWLFPEAPENSMLTSRLFSRSQLSSEIWGWKHQLLS